MIGKRAVKAAYAGLLDLLPDVDDDAG